MDNDQLQALKTVIKYLWDEEEKDWESNPSDNHIFNDLTKLQAYVDNKRG